MNDTTSSPSRLLHATAVTARWMLGLLIAAWLLFALSVVVLHGWIVPRSGEYRPALEAQASKAIGVPVRIGAISALSEGLFPTFELHDVVLHDGLGREALRLARVVASVSPRSLWRFNFEQIYIESPEVDVRRDAMGKLHVAGLDMAADTSGDTRAADWFFSQREFAIKGGTVRWTDETRGVAPLLLTDVTFVVRNSTRRHALRLDATPPEGWGQRFTMRGQFRQPLLSAHNGKWQTWDGQLYADFPHMDVTRLGAYVSLDARIREGNGALRLWADVNDGQVQGGAVDLALSRVDAALGEKLEPLVLRDVTGRLAGEMNDEAFSFATTDLQFIAADSTRWPGGNLSFRRTPAKGRPGSERGEFRADRLDLGALAQIASRMPLDDVSHRALATFALRGLVERIEASWQGPLAKPEKYQARGRVSGLAIASQAAEPAPVRPPSPRGTNVPAAVPTGTPGVRGATVVFDATQAGGTADVAILKGALEFPGVFEEPVVPIDQLSGKLAWKLDGSGTQVQVTGLRFSNADTQGEAKAEWRTSDPATSRSHGRYPGVLDLQGQLTKADGTRVFRYLPLVIPKTTRDYVRDSVNKGTAPTVDFKVRGDLYDMPFMDPKQGDFRIAAKVADVTYAYVPPAPGAPPAADAWPALTGLSGELIFERAGMQVRNARGHLVGMQGIEVTKADAEIADMSHAAPLLKIDGLAKGPLPSMIKAAGTIVGGATGEAIARARATGNADYKVRLELPLEAMEKFKLQTSVLLTDNELQPVPEAPAFLQARGTLSFTESGFTLAGLQARMAGGEVKVEGHGRYGGNNGSELVFKAQGTATAEGLRGLREVSWLSRLAKRTSGSTPYAGAFSLRDGVAEFSLTSSLQGLALELPAPLIKPAADAMALRLEKKLLPRASPTAPARDELQVDLGKLASIRYQRDISGSEPKVINGAIGVGLDGAESAVPPARGVLANIRLARFDVDAWKSVFSEATGAQPEALNASAEEEASGYLPTLVVVRAQELVLSRRKLQNVVLGGSREGAVWRANIDASDLNGYAEYRQSHDGRLYARLARLRIAPSEATEVESLLDEQPGTLPALDIVVDDFELFNRHLGRAEINAVNLGGASREWRLNKLALLTPEASFAAEGNWAALPATATPGRRMDARLTNMRFTLDITDVGLLLNRFNMKDVVRRGHGRLEGEVNWRGSPFSLDYPSLGGKLHIDVETGQFLKADPGLAKLLGVLSLQALPRRLTLDFRDIFSQGFQFDFIRGDAKISEGTASTNNLQMKGVNAAVLMEGTANIVRETQSLHVVVVPEISAGTAALAATVINPAIGLAAFLAQAALSKPLSAAATQEFQIDGTWADPKITKVPRRGAQEVKQ